MADTAGADTGTVNRFTLRFNTGNALPTIRHDGSNDVADAPGKVDEAVSPGKEVGLLEQVSNYLFGA